MKDEIALKHLYKIGQEPIVPKNGLICYTYNNAEQDEAYYNPMIMNIGDYIQSLAARQYLNHIDEYVDRDQLGEYDGDNINMIMNAWYSIWKKNLVFSRKIRPLLVAVHINNSESITDETLKYFKDNEPVGCRDHQTMNFFKAKGIAAYFSGCLTLTLGETYKVDAGERNENIYFVDYKLGEKENKLIDKEIAKILKKYPRSPIRYKTHMYPLNKDIEGSLYEAECLINDYARAKLVITQNIHCALPCLSLGTPVILVMPEFDKKRFWGIYNLFNYIKLDDEGRAQCEITTDVDGGIINKDDYREYSEFLKEICMKFFHINKMPCNKCKYKAFADHKIDSKDYKIKSKLFRKIKNGERRTIVIFGFIKISYRRRRKKICAETAK